MRFRLFRTLEVPLIHAELNSSLEDTEMLIYIYTYVAILIATHHFVVISFSGQLGTT